MVDEKSAVGGAREAGVGRFHRATGAISLWHRSRPIFRRALVCFGTRVVSNAQLTHHRDARMHAIRKRYLLCGQYSRNERSRKNMERAVKFSGFWQSRTRKSGLGTPAD